MAEEQIRDKARLYAVERARAAFPTMHNSPDSLILMTCGFDARELADAFEAGAEYALNSIWRKTEEEKPQDGQWVLGIYSDSTCLYWMKYNYCEEENDEWWCDRERDEVNPPEYWMAIPKSPLWNNFSEEIW